MYVVYDAWRKHKTFFVRIKVNMTGRFFKIQNELYHACSMIPDKGAKNVTVKKSKT